MKATELRSKSVKELKQMLNDKKVELNTFSKTVLAGKEKNVSRMKIIKREIALINTVLTESIILEEIGGMNA